MLKNEYELSEEEIALLLKNLNSFRGWLVKRKIVKSLPEVEQTIDFPFANEDWVMRVNDSGTKVSFNSLLRKRCSFGYYQSIIIHEYFHLMVQKLPNKEDAVRVKDYFGSELMKLIDIEADLYTALYYKQELNYGLIDYLKIYYEGGKVFSDTRIRTIKFERFIGTILSICKLFISNNNTDQFEDVEFDLYLPSISPIYTESSLHVLVLKREHIYVDEVFADYKDFVEIKRCYLTDETVTLKDFVNILAKFAYKAFNRQMPKGLLSKIKEL